MAATYKVHRLRCTLLAVLVVLLAWCSSSAGDDEIRYNKDYYTAAVFEHGRLGNYQDNKPEEIIEMNLAIFRKAAEVAKSKDADIIVFPEYGIFPPLHREQMESFMESVPDPRKKRYNPCEQATEFANKPMLYNLSCIARDNRIVVVANMGDKQPCDLPDRSNCPSTGSYHYNADVAFDRDGTVLARYQKEHLFFEDNMDLPLEKQDSFFRTDFGTFGMYVCFDIMYEPMAVAARNESIDNLILSTMWIDTMPLLTSVQRWQSWVVGNNSTLLAANAHVPGHRSLGSGVFSGRMGPLVYTYNPDGLSKLAVARVPRSARRSSAFPDPQPSITVIKPDGFEPYDEKSEERAEHFDTICDFDILGPPQNMRKDYRCAYDDTESYNMVKLTAPSGRAEACHNGLCCALTYQTEPKNESYYLGAFNGTYTILGFYNWTEEKCFVVRCDPSKNQTDKCEVFPTRSETVFRKLELTGNFSTNYVYPTVLETGMRLAAHDEWQFDVQSRDATYDALLRYRCSSWKPFLVAGLYARDYDRDPPFPGYKGGLF